MRMPILALILMGGCPNSTPTNRSMPNFDIDASGGYAQPWPGDQHLDPDGSISFESFVRPADVGLVETYIAIGESQIGWGNNSPIYLTTDAPVDVSLLPSPFQSLEEDSALLLVDVDPASPYRGERFPVRWRISGEVSAYQPENLLAIAPAAGFPLRPHTTYALLLTDQGFLVNPAFQEVFKKGHPHFELWEPVREGLSDLGLRRKNIAGGTVFTTTDPLDEMARIARHVQSVLPPPDLDQDLEAIGEADRFSVYRTSYASPVFTFGERPFFAEGGEFRFEPDGTPLIASWDAMRLAVCVPKNATMPTAGWPTVIYQHGTGGSYLSACNSNQALAPGGVVADAGFVVLGIDQPLHGPRNGGLPTSDLANFNIVNPASGRTNFRQGAADALYLARALSRRTTTMGLPDGSSLALDPDSITFVGHSQGGLTGAIASSFWAGDVDATVLSGAGGLLAITVVDRKDILDFAALVAQIARFADGEEVHELHPLLGLVQMLVEPTDPVNYAPYWFSEPLNYPGHSPSRVLATSGTLDANTPYRGALAMGVAGRLPPLPPRATVMTGMELRQIDDTPSPAIDNASGYEGPITAGFSQWEDGSHFVIFEEWRAATLYSGFLSSAVEGNAVLDLPTENGATP